MGLWLDVAFVHTADLAAVEGALVALFFASGRERISPKPREPERMDPMQYGKPASVKRWGSAIFPGAAGWTVCLTAPMNVLVEPRGADDELLLGKLARALRVDAFQYDVHDGDSHRIIEAGPKGTIVRSGFLSPEIHDEASSSSVEPRFHLVESEVNFAGSIEADVAPRIQRVFGGANACYCDNLTIIHHLIPHVALPTKPSAMIIASA
jgi:hypothetical protein